MSNNMELIQKIANKVGAASTDVDDLIFALCLSERHFGKTIEGSNGGQNKLNIQSAIASGFGIDLKSKTRSIAGIAPLEGIQEKRLICDTCYMLTKGKVEGTELTMPSSAKLIKNRHSDFTYVTDVVVCDEYIELYKSSLEECDYDSLFNVFSSYDSLFNNKMNFAYNYSDYLNLPLNLPIVLKSKLGSEKMFSYKNNVEFNMWWNSYVSKKNLEDIYSSYSTYIDYYLYDYICQKFINELEIIYRKNKTNFAVVCNYIERELKDDIIYVNCPYKFAIYTQVNDRLFKQHINRIFDLNSTNNLSQDRDSERKKLLTVYSNITKRRL